MNRSAIILTAALLASGCATMGVPAPVAPAVAGAEAGDPVLASIIADGTYQAINDKFFSVNLLTLEQ